LLRRRGASIVSLFIWLAVGTAVTIGTALPRPSEKDYFTPTPVGILSVFLATCANRMVVLVLDQQGLHEVEDMGGVFLVLVDIGVLRCVIHPSLFLDKRQHPHRRGPLVDSQVSKVSA